MTAADIHRTRQHLSLVLNVHGAEIAREPRNRVDAAVVTIDDDVVRRCLIRLQHEELRGRGLPGRLEVIEVIARHGDEILRRFRIECLPLR